MKNLEMNSLTPGLIIGIERALNISLYSTQIDYLVSDEVSPAYDNVRGSGKTTAYCIKLALSSGEPLNILNPLSFSDAKYTLELSKDNYNRYSESFFRHEFMTIRATLKVYGFPVRELCSKRVNGGYIIGD